MGEGRGEDVVVDEAYSLVVEAKDGCVYFTLDEACSLGPLDRCFIAIDGCKPRDCYNMEFNYCPYWSNKKRWRLGGDWNAYFNKNPGTVFEFKYHWKSHLYIFRLNNVEKENSGEVFFEVRRAIEAYFVYFSPLEAQMLTGEKSCGMFFYERCWWIITFDI